MARAPGLFDVDARLRELSAKGDEVVSRKWWKFVGGVISG